MATVLELKSIEFRRETPSAGTFIFGLTEGGLDYEPGQYVSIKLEGVNDPRGPQRPFTLSTSPTENGQIGITIKMTGSPFKDGLQKIADEGNDPGDRIRMRGPMGSFTLDKERPAVMIAGGIGITPFRSMIRYAKDQNAGLPIVLLYSNDVPEDIVFREELDTLAKEEDWLTVVHTITRAEKSKKEWSGRTGRINRELIQKQAGPLENPVYYVCGPPGMVSAMTGIIQELPGVGQSDLRFEKFTGY